MLSLGCKSEPEPDLSNARIAQDADAADAVDGPDLDITDGDPPDAASDADADDPGGLQIDTLSAPVAVSYDDDGVVHLQCAQARDCFVAQGYVHARDRFFQMDVTRNQTRGELSRMAGHFAGYDSDVFWRTRLATEDGGRLEDAFYDTLSDESKDVFRAYTDGVNAWLAHLRAGTHGAKLSAEYGLSFIYGVDDIRPWEPQDSLSVFFQLAYTYSGGDGDAWRGEIAAGVDPAIAADLFAAPDLVGGSVVGTASSALRTLPSAPPTVDWQDRLRPFQDVMRATARDEARFGSVLFSAGPDYGSNSWSVAPTRTSTGVALMSNDPHLDATSPSIWYLVHMQSAAGDLHVAGASIPSGPGVIIGHNEQIAWGATIAYLDVGDVYAENLNADGTAVTQGGVDVPIVRTDIEIEGTDGQTRPATIEIVPGHGPIIAKDQDAGTAVSFKWVGHEPTPEMDFLIQLMRATSVEEAETALDNLRSINVAWTVADAGGSIGWLPKGDVPNRSWASASQPTWLPLPGDGSAEWAGFVDRATIPDLIDPTAGFVVASNSDFVGDWEDGDNTNDGHPPMQQILSIGSSYRQQRIAELLRASTAHDIESMRSVLDDTRVVHGALLVPEIVTTADTLALSPEASAVVEAMRGWNFTCPSGLQGFDPAVSNIDPTTIGESAGCAAFHVVFHQLTVAIFDELDFMGPGFVSDNYPRWQKTLLNLFLAPASMSYGAAFFDDAQTPAVETRDDMVQTALESAAAWLGAAYSSFAPDSWAWGRVHGLDQASLLGLPQFALGPYATPGGFQTVNVAGPNWDTDSANHTAASSIRLLYELGPDGVRGWFELPAGQVHHEDSPFYQNLIDAWLRGQRTPLRFSESEVDEALYSEETFVP